MNTKRMPGFILIETSVVKYHLSSHSLHFRCHSPLMLDISDISHSSCQEKHKDGDDLEAAADESSPDGGSIPVAAPTP